MSALRNIRTPKQQRNANERAQDREHKDAWYRFPKIGSNSRREEEESDEKTNRPKAAVRCTKAKCEDDEDRAAHEERGTAEYYVGDHLTYQALRDLATCSGALEPPDVHDGVEKAHEAEEYADEGNQQARDCAPVHEVTHRMGTSCSGYCAS